MNNFRTEVFPTQSPIKINHDNSIMLIGSCFTDNIGTLLTQNKFAVLSNPFGISYNPISLFNSLVRALNNRLYNLSDLNQNNDLWFHYDFHSTFSNTDKNQVLTKINNAIANTHQTLIKADFLFITLGTAWAFRLKEHNKTVANCHKMPAKYFDRYLQETSQIVESFQKFIKLAQQNNPKLKIVFTLSPIRHWRDGAVNNQISKSTLTLAIHQITQQFQNCSYFPSYEIIMDDLRDYRFYQADMLHITQPAIEYIWEKFSNTFFHSSTIELNKQITKLRKAFTHRPFRTNDPNHKAFVEQTINRMEQLETQHPNINFTAEKTQLKTINTI